MDLDRLAITAQELVVPVGTLLLKLTIPPQEPVVFLLFLDIG